MKPLRHALAFAGLLMAARAGAEQTNAAISLAGSPSLVDAGPSLLRVLGALALVLGLFLGGVWFFRNGRQAILRGGRVPRLNVLESRSLGGRHAIHVIGYDQERFLIASSPAGMNLLSQLPAAPEPEPLPSTQPARNLSFAQTLAQVLKGQPVGAKPGACK